MATIRFLLQSKNNPSNIYLRLSVSHDLVIKRKTGYIINPDDWSYKSGLPKENDSETKNLKTTLVKLSAKILEFFNDAVKQGDEITGDWLRDQIDIIQGKKKPTDNDRLLNYIQSYLDNLPYKEYPNGKRGASSGTMKKYTTLKNKIEAYENYKKKAFYIKDVGLTFRNDLVKYFQEIEKLNTNTTGQYIKFLKIVCRDADKSGIEINRQLSQIKGFTEKSEKIFLTFDELDKIENTPFTRPALENAKDWLIIGCYIGQRVGDLLNLTRDNIVIRAGLELIELTQEKTGKAVSIPMHPKVKAILDKRKGEFPYNISDQKFNEYIKDVCKLAGINQIVNGGKLAYNENDEFWRKRPGTYEKWELITSHVCRRSYASNFYGEIPTALLISITAHSTEKQFLEYIGKNQNDYAVQIAEYYSKMALQAVKEPQMTVVKQAQ